MEKKMKASITFLFCTFIMLPAKASIELLEEIGNSYTTISKSLIETDSEPVIRRVHSSEDLNKLSMEDWIIYAKASNKKEKDGEDLKEVNSIKFKVIDNFTQIFSAYQNEPVETLEESFKKSLVKSWWIAALIDEEERDSLKAAYKVGKEALIEKNDMARVLLNNIERFLSL